MITLETRDFVRGIDLAALAMERRNTLPILSCLRMKPGAGGGLIVSGTDLDMQIDAAVSADLNGSGAFEMALTAPQMLGLAAKRTGAKTISLTEADKHGMKTAVNCGRFDYTWGTLPAEEWPDMDAAPQTELVTGTLGSEFIRGLRRVAPCISEEETRYYLNGVHLHRGDADWKFVLVATDGHRMTISEFFMPDVKGEIPDHVIIPKRTIDTILALTKGKESPSIGFTLSSPLPRNSPPTPAQLADTSAKRCEFRIGNVRILSKLIDGTFPEYRRVIPSDAPVRATFTRADLRQASEALRFASNRRGNRFGGTALRIELHDGQATMSSAWADEGISGRTVIPYEGAGASGCVFGVNSRYLAELLAVFAPNERITLAFPSVENAPSHPITIVSPEDGTTLSVLMPMRV